MEKNFNQEAAVTKLTDDLESGNAGVTSAHIALPKRIYKCANEI